MKCCETFRSTSGEGAYLSKTDASVLKHRDQTGLETLVVYALNDANSLLVMYRSSTVRENFIEKYKLVV